VIDDHKSSFTIKEKELLYAMSFQKYAQIKKVHSRIEQLASQFL
jgi:hypothetical protein